MSKHAFVGPVLTVVVAALIGSVPVVAQTARTEAPAAIQLPVGVQVPLTPAPAQVPAAGSEPEVEAKIGSALIGHDAFDVDVETITPGPIDGSYVLSPGDAVQLRVWGQLQLTYDLVVSPDQYLMIPEVLGRVYIGTHSLSEVADLITRHLATAYQTYFNLDNPAASTASVDLVLGKVRGVSFVVQGEVVTPGSYTLHPSLANLIYAIAQAGGVRNTASLRNIQIRRGTEKIDVDFYDFLLRGTVGQNELQIRNGDTIFVPLTRKQVAIQGEVRRPGIFALDPASDEDLETLLEFAGGVKPTANTERVVIRRVEPNTGPQTVNVNLAQEALAKRRVLLQDQDVVTVLESETRRRDFVSLQGNGVKVPGEYPLSTDMRVVDLLQGAGGLRPDAYLERADLVSTGSDMRQTFRQVNLRLAAEGDPVHNVTLESLDELIVTSVIDVIGGDGEVTLRGHVKSPGVVALSAGMRLYDLLFTRAGLQDRDFMRESYLPRADLIRVVSGSNRQELITFDLGKLLAGDPAENLALQSDDEVVVYTRDEILGTERFVELSGFVKTPGPHSLLQGMRLLDLLKGPGGFEDPDRRRDAYLPRAEVWRKTGRGDRVELEILRFDLGAALNGDATQNPLLESGDEIVAYAAADFTEERTVEIAGAVNKAGTYDFASNMTLGDLLVRAGGLLDLADTQVADLFRVGLTADGQMSRESTSIPLSDLSRVLQSSDRVLVRRRAGYQPSRVVAVAGQIQYPNRYSLSAGGRLADVIRMAGGLLDDAFLDGASLYRRGADDFEPMTRIVLDFDRALKSPDASDNLLLEDGDRIFVPRRSNTVTVVDAVQQPITIAFANGKGVKYYLQAAGGLTADADSDAVAVMLPSGRYAPKRFLRGPEILSGSTIVVPARAGLNLRPVTMSPAEGVFPQSAEVPQRRTDDVSEELGASPAEASRRALSPEGVMLPSATESSAALAIIPQGAQSASGFVSALTGTCPALAFDLGTVRVTTTEGTVFTGASCTDLKEGDVVAVTAVRQTGRVVAALEVRRR